MKVSRTVAFICLVLGTSMALAQAKDAIVPTLYLKAIQAKTQTEVSGDEVYLAITEFSPGGKNRHYTVPQFPLRWPAGALPHIADLALWKTVLGSGESTEVVVSVVEHDTPPWNLDDMIGSIKIKMLNEKGVLKSQWIPIDKEAREQTVIEKEKTVHSYPLRGEGGHYQVDFLLEGVKN